MFIYLQGQKRFGALTSSWLFHEVSHVDHATKQTTKLDRGAWERLVEKYMGPAGVSESWIADMNQSRFAAGTPGVKQFWAGIAAACKVPGQPFGANPHAMLTG